MVKKNQRPWQYGGDAGGDEKCDGGDGCVAADGGEDYQCGPLHAPETHLDQQTDAAMMPIEVGQLEFDARKQKQLSAMQRRHRGMGGE